MTPVCTTYKNLYNEQIEQAMRADPRCAGFPGLLTHGDRASKKPKVSNACYEQLPIAIRYGNNNTDPACRAEVATVRQLENHPDFEHDKKIRRAWQAQFDRAMALGCTL